MVRIVSPTNGAVFLAPANITLLASARDQDGYLTIQTVEFFEGTNSLGITTNLPVLNPIGPFIIDWSNVPPGQYSITAKAVDAAGAIGVSAPVHIFVNRPGPPPEVSVEASWPYAIELPMYWPIYTAAEFTLSRTGSLEESLTVAYAVSGTAANAIDYAELPGSVTFEAGASNAIVTVVPLEDDLAEGTELVQIDLLEIHSQGSPQPSPYTVGQPGSAVAYLIDDETPVPTITLQATDPIASEKLPFMSSIDPARFTLVRTGDNGYPLEVPYIIGGTAVNGEDYQTISGHVAFPVGASNAFVDIRPLYDARVETNETVVLELTALPLGTPAFYTIGEPRAATVSIRDSGSLTNLAHGFLKAEYYTNIAGMQVADLTNNPAFPDHPSYVTYVTSCETPSEIDNNYGARLTGFVLPAITGDYVFYLSADDQGALFLSTDMFPENKALIAFQENYNMPRQWETAAKSEPVHLEAGGRYYVEALLKEAGGGDHLEVAWQMPGNSAPTNGDPPIPSVFLATPRDYPTNPAPKVTIAASDPVASEPQFDDLGMPVADPGAFEISRQGDLAAPLAVWVNISGTAINGVDYSPIANPIIIPAGESRVSVQLWPLSDETLEAAETVVLAITPNPAYLIGAPGSATVTIHDFTPFDPVTVNVFATDPEAKESGVLSALFPGRFTIVRTGYQDIDVPVFFTLSGTASNGVDYRFISNQVVIPAGKIEARIDVVPLNDNLVEGTETVTLSIESPNCIQVFPPSPGCYQAGVSNQATVFIADAQMATNQPPVIVLNTPTNGATYSPRTPILLGVDAHDPDGTLLKVEFFANSDFIGQADGPWRTPYGNYIFYWTNVPAGDYAITAKATDNRGASATAGPVQISVIDDEQHFMRGILRWEVYADIRGALLADLTNNAAFPDQPSSTEWVPSFESPSFIADSYGGRLSGYLLPPVTGEYVFYISSDDQGALFLSPDENPEHKVQIAYEPVWSPARTWGDPWYGRTNNENVSAPIYLEAGRRYYVEALVKEEYGGDNLGVTWQLPGQPPPANGEPPISGEYLAIRRTNLPPTVTISRPADGAVFEAPATIQIEAVTQDPDGYANTVEFFANDHKIGQSTILFIKEPEPGEQLHITFTWTNATTGTYVLTARTRDQQGLEGVSAPVSVTVRDAQPPPDRELHVVGVYSGMTSAGSSSRDHELGEAAVLVNRPGRRVTLFLSAYEPVLWHVTATSNTIVEKVFLTGYYRQQITGVAPGTEVVSLNLQDGGPYFWVGYSVESGQFYHALSKVYALTGLEVSSFHGAYTASFPAPYVIDSIQDDPRLRLDYPQPTPVSELPVNPAFQLAFYTGGGSAADGWVFLRDYTLAGPSADARLFPGLPVVPDFAGTPEDYDQQHYYTIDGQEVMEIALDTAAVRDLTPAIPQMSWPMGITFDSQRQRILLVSLGGAGELYAYAPTQDRWSVVSDMNQLDLNCLAYHAADDQLYGVTVLHSDGGYPELYRFGADGSYRARFQLPFLPFGTGPGSYRSWLVSTGDYLVLMLAPRYVYFGGSEAQEERIYLIDPKSGKSWLTYRKALLPENRPPTVAVTSPNSDAVIEAGSSIELTATAADSDGFIQSIEFFANGQSLGHRSSANPYGNADYRLEWTNPQPGAYSLTASATDNQGASTVSAPVQISVQSAVRPPVVTLTAANSVAKERHRNGTARAAKFKVHRTGDTNESLRVFYSISGTAENGVDYERLSSPVVIPAGTRKAFICVTPVDDAIPEEPETVILTLNTHPQIATAYELGEPRTAAAVIMDNDDAVKSGTSILPGRLVQIKLPAATGANFRLEMSTNLMDWITVHADASVEDGAVNVVDPEAPNLPCRFYRLVPVLEPAGLADED